MDFIEENNKRKITNCFILYVDKDCSEKEKETVCNFKCLMCYYRFSNQKMKTLNEMKSEVNKMIGLGANHVQITGAEPTIHKDIIELIKYIKSKNLVCSVITNGYLIAIESVAKKYKGLVDYFLMSIHGIGKTWNEISQVKDAYEHTIKALENCKKLKIDVHFNTTTVKQNYKQLNEIILLAKKYGIKRCNFINFNPFCSFKTLAGQNVVNELIVSYDELMPYLEEAHDLCLANNIDFAMRYFPMCKVPEEMRKYNFNYSTLMFDWNEWNYRYWFPDDFSNGLNRMKKFIENKGLEGTDEQKLLHAFGRFYPGFRSNFTELEECKRCNDYLICDCPHTEQLQQFPNQVFNRTKPPFKKNAKYYIEKEMI
jgi:pyruvate-formate lyase-activating enzyme